jgi:hypothetical protein
MSIVDTVQAPAFVLVDGEWQLVLGEFPMPMGQGYGDTIEVLGGRSVAESNIISVIPGGFLGPAGTLVGDAAGLTGHARGGDDSFTVELRGSTILGDALRMDAHARGGDDTIAVASGSGATVVGDATLMFGHARGGDDRITLANIVSGSEVFGDAEEMGDHGRGGNDLITVLNAPFFFSLVAGDARTMTGQARGGDDHIVAGDAPLSFERTTTLVGDAVEMSDHAKGGDDVLVSGTATDLMWGDGQVMSDHAAGGGDTFVFLHDSGNDFIEDFVQGQDLIDARAYGAFPALTLEVSGQDTVIHLDAENSVTVIGLIGLGATDFV